MSKFLELTRVEKLKVSASILVRGKKKKERRKRSMGIHSKRRELEERKKVDR